MLADVPGGSGPSKHAISQQVCWALHYVCKLYQLCCASVLSVSQAKSTKDRRALKTQQETAVDTFGGPAQVANRFTQHDISMQQETAVDTFGRPAQVANRSTQHDISMQQPQQLLPQQISEQQVFTLQAQAQAAQVQAARAAQAALAAQAVWQANQFQATSSPFGTPAQTPAGQIATLGSGAAGSQLMYVPGAAGLAAAGVISQQQPNSPHSANGWLQLAHAAAGLGTEAESEGIPGQVVPNIPQVMQQAAGGAGVGLAAPVVPGQAQMQALANSQVQMQAQAQLMHRLEHRFVSLQTLQQVSKCHRLQHRLKTNAEPFVPL